MGEGWGCSSFQQQDRGWKEASSAIDPLTAALSILEGASSTDASWEMTVGLEGRGENAHASISGSRPVLN